MNELQIDYFLSIAETLNITESARRLFVSAPAVSKQLRLLEDELGFPLFVRKARGLSILPAGSRLRDNFISQREDISVLRREMRSQAEQNGRTLRIGLPDDWAAYALLRRLEEEIADQGVLLQIIGIENMTLLDSIQDGTSDMVLYPIAGPMEKSSLHHQYLCPLHRVILYGTCRKDIPNQPELADLIHLPMLMTHEYVRENTRQLMLSHGFYPELISVGSMASVLQAVGAGRGTALTDEWCWAASHPDFRCLLLPDTMHVGIFWNPDTQNPLVETAADILSRNICAMAASRAPVKEQ